MPASKSENKIDELRTRLQQQQNLLKQLRASYQPFEKKSVAYFEQKPKKLRAMFKSLADQHTLERTVKRYYQQLISKKESTSHEAVLIAAGSCLTPGIVGALKIELEQKIEKIQTTIHKIEQQVNEFYPTTNHPNSHRIFTNKYKSTDNKQATEPQVLIANH